MPVYEYVCDSCGYAFERIQSFHDDPVSRCPACKGKVRRVISPVGVIFKGSGWYITDHRRQITGPSKPKLSDGKTSEGLPADEKAAKETPRSGAGSAGSDGTGSGRGSKSADKKKPATKEAD